MQFEAVEKDLQNTIRQMKPGQDAQKELKRIHDALDEKDKIIKDLEGQLDEQEKETDRVLEQLDKEKEER